MYRVKKLGFTDEMGDEGGVAGIEFMDTGEVGADMFLSSKILNFNWIFVDPM